MNAKYVTMEKIEVYTDGSVYPNPNGNGGWGFFATWGKFQCRGWGCDISTTNNRMEVAAAIGALKFLASAPESHVVIHSDSQYLINTMTKGWAKRTNNDLWDQLGLLLGKHTVSWVWVRGHNGNSGNEIADKLAEHGRLSKTNGVKVEKCETSNT